MGSDSYYKVHAFEETVDFLKLILTKSEKFVFKCDSFAVRSLKLLGECCELLFCVLEMKISNTRLDTRQLNHLVLEVLSSPFGSNFTAHHLPESHFSNTSLQKMQNVQMK